MPCWHWPCPPCRYRRNINDGCSFKLSLEVIFHVATILRIINIFLLWSHNSSSSFMWELHLPQPCRHYPTRITQAWLTLDVTVGAFSWQKPSSKLLSNTSFHFHSCSYFTHHCHWDRVSFCSPRLAWSLLCSPACSSPKFWGSPYFSLWITGRCYHTYLRAHWLAR